MKTTNQKDVLMDAILQFELNGKPAEFPLDRDYTLCRYGSNLTIVSAIQTTAEELKGGKKL